ncbi:DUF3150 domain-containing protein [Cronobacter dublinensis subsp. dublinensis]|nr:DUF3150 domain-containing protein [Cronobacter dublinensis subsp. dublinensis]
MTNATSNVNKVLESLILVSLSEIHGISGRKKLKREDFGENVELPPDVIVSLGSKKVIDPKLLNPFTQYKTKAHALCSAVGIRFLGGYAVPADRVNDLISSLNDVKTEFYIYKKTFLKADFDSWIDQCEEKYRKILRDGASVDVEYMDNQIQFGFTAIHITPYGNSVIQEGIAGQIKSLTDEVFEEVSGLVDGFLKNLNQTAFTQHTINPLRRTADKLSSLGFISDRVNKLAVYISDVLADVPVTGKVTGRKYSDILSLLNNLRDPQRAKSFVDLLNADADQNQSSSGNGFIDLSPADEVIYQSVQPTLLNEFAEAPSSLSSSAINVDPDEGQNGNNVVEDFLADSVSVPEEPKTPSLAKPLPEYTETLNDDELPTDLPSGNEVVNEPVFTESKPTTSAIPIIEEVTASQIVQSDSGEGFGEVEVVDDQNTKEFSSNDRSLINNGDMFVLGDSNDGLMLF